jgi:hypothetical protein
VALAAQMVLAVADVAAATAREDELKRVINRNTGLAHMTRGMNMYTLIADLPVLRRLVFDRDYVTQLSAAGVLVDMGAGGRAALVSALPEATEHRARSTIQDALREADDLARRPLSAYPLDERERKRIRGCGAAPH